MSEETRAYRVLIVDDEQNLREGSGRILSRQGLEVQTAENGKEALARLAEQPADIMLLDLKMPGMDGLEVLDRVRSAHPDVLVIIATGFATIETAIEAMKKGAYDFMTKPFRPDQLRLIVGRAVEHIQMRQELERLSEERERGLWAITTEHSRLRTVVDSIIAGLLITEPDQRIVMSNPAFHKMVRISKDGFIGSFVGDYPAIKTVVELMDEILSGQSDETGSLTREFVILGDRPTYIRATVNAVTSEDAALLGLVAVLRDITAQKEQEKEKMAFVAMLTHELRSPLGAVDTQFHVVLKGLAGELTEKQRDMFTRMRARIGNVLALINDLLDLSRIEAHQFVGEKKPTDLNQVILETIDAIEAQAEAKGIELVRTLEPELPRINADPSALKDVTTNLIANAIRYTPDNGRVEVETWADPDWVLFMVTDNGLGIAPEYHEKIFERFFRVKDERARKTGGTGLGLPIVKAIVEDHQGVVELDSDVGRGSVFSVRLPRAD